MQKHCYRRKALKLNLLRWVEGFPLVPLQFWSNSNKGNKKEGGKWLISSGKQPKKKEGKKRVMNSCKSPKIMAALWVWFFKSIGVVFCGSNLFFLLAILILKKSISGNIQISKHPPRDALVNSMTNACKVSWIFSGAAHQLTPLMGGEGSSLNLRTF